ncbi:MAG: hypothetical protein IT244_07420 [Bacteroidia bacterium]|nr:hypothetical protein [Bacteroidia bacterium]
MRLIFCILCYFFALPSIGQHLTGKLSSSNWIIGQTIKVSFTFTDSNGRVYSQIRRKGEKRLADYKLYPETYGFKIDANNYIMELTPNLSNKLPGDSFRIICKIWHKRTWHQWDTTLFWPKIVKVVPSYWPSENHPAGKPIRDIELQFETGHKASLGANPALWNALTSFNNLNYFENLPMDMVIEEGKLRKYLIWGVAYRNSQKSIWKDSLPINFAYTAIYNGTGASGRNGSNGSNGFDADEHNDGKPGEGGEGGWTGLNGQEVLVFANCISTEDAMWKVKIIDDENTSIYYLNLLDSNTQMVLNLTGGRGGNGGDGGHGGDGYNGGNAGSGGYGGNGGNGGTATIYVDSLNQYIQQRFVVLQNGGIAGNGGDGGRGGKPKRNEKDDNGTPGENGSAGDMGRQGFSGKPAVFLPWKD